MNLSKPTFAVNSADMVEFNLGDEESFRPQPLRNCETASRTFEIEEGDCSGVESHGSVDSNDTKGATKKVAAPTDSWMAKEEGSDSNSSIDEEDELYGGAERIRRGHLWNERNRRSRRSRAVSNTKGSYETEEEEKKESGQVPSDFDAAKTDENKAGYYCKYCDTSWPFSHFRNAQQFGAHCSNCSRKRKVKDPQELTIRERNKRMRKNRSMTPSPTSSSVSAVFKSADSKKPTKNQRTASAPSSPLLDDRDFAATFLKADDKCSARNAPKPMRKTDEPTDDINIVDDMDSFEAAAVLKDHHLEEHEDFEQEQEEEEADVDDDDNESKRASGEMSSFSLLASLRYKGSSNNRRKRKESSNISFTSRKKPKSVVHRRHHHPHRNRRHQHTDSIGDSSSPVDLATLASSQSSSIGTLLVAIERKLTAEQKKKEMAAMKHRLAQLRDEAGEMCNTGIEKLRHHSKAMIQDLRADMLAQVEAIKLDLTAELTFREVRRRERINEMRLQIASLNRILDAGRNDRSHPLLFPPFGAKLDTTLGQLEDLKASMSQDFGSKEALLQQQMNEMRTNCSMYLANIKQQMTEELNIREGRMQKELDDLRSHINSICSQLGCAEKTSISTASVAIPIVPVAASPSSPFTLDAISSTSSSSSTASSLLSASSLVSAAGSNNRWGNNACKPSLPAVEIKPPQRILPSSNILAPSSLLKPSHGVLASSSSSSPSPKVVLATGVPPYASVVSASPSSLEKMHLAASPAVFLPVAKELKTVS